VIRTRCALPVASLVAMIGLAGTASGESADFSVMSGNKTFRLSEARGKFVVLHFLMKTECPACQAYVAETTRRAPEVAGVVHLFLKPDSEDEIKAWSDKLQHAGVAATIYRDADAKLAREFKIPDGYAFHGESVHYPALVLLGPSGQEEFRYVGKDNTDRLPFERLAAKVAEASKNAAIGQYNLTEGTLALGGHDAVAYIESGKAQPGKSELSSSYRGAVYRFASAEKREKFAENPEKYVPAYGGWCATAMAEGRKVEIDPANFKVTNGRLFLFYKGWLGNALNDWNKDEKSLTVRADEQWRKITPGDATERK
jgi:thioredoxin-dependent peroxiredoxin